MPHIAFSLVFSINTDTCLKWAKTDKQSCSNMVWVYWVWVEEEFFGRIQHCFITRAQSDCLFLLALCPTVSIMLCSEQPHYFLCQCSVWKTKISSAPSCLQRDLRLQDLSWKHTNTQARVDGYAHKQGDRERQMQGCNFMSVVKTCALESMTQFGCACAWRPPTILLVFCKIFFLPSSSSSSSSLFITTFHLSIQNSVI